MPLYICRIGMVDGSVITRTIEGTDEAIVRGEVARQGGRLFSIRKEVKSAAKKMLAVPTGGFSLAGLLPRRGRRAVKGEEFLVFNQELVALLRAGLPIVTGFEILLERQKNPHFRRILTDIREQIVSGVALSDAFLSHGDVFPRLYATSLKAGERSGEVEAVVRRFLSYQKILGSVRRKVVGAMVYPAVLVGLSVSLIMILMSYVIPKFTEFYSGFGGELPLLTRVVIGTANATKRHIVEILVAVVAVAVFFERWRKTPAGGKSWDGLLLKLPILGGILHQFSISQFTRSLATMIGAGTPLVSALEISSGSVGNRKIAAAVESVVPKVRQGAELWRSLDETGQFTSLAVEMVKVGEATGALEDMLMNVSEFYDETIEASLQKVINLIEPVILIVMGGVIATILLSVYLPMFTLLNQIKG